MTVESYKLLGITLNYDAHEETLQKEDSFNAM